ncbi:hypothetical protein [Stakelama tenebrarum]|uniref:Uncharacterized protein n=1 Tax=Stakelama tenebrarum TaxID=2711215 RepID=A0A6G6Y8B6_9SPHN|nr:hypothetical protein [Sphingosinithalassobacter tenebrarum]QIG81159.1 hypothetical protein G5C33_16160 [Sphingosinithalassobacter tenebrarum]
MYRLLALLPATVAAPALAASDSGGRTMPQLSDIALVAFAALALWFVRRAMRARARKSREAGPSED